MGLLMSLNSDPLKLTGLHLLPYYLSIFISFSIFFFFFKPASLLFSFLCSLPLCFWCCWIDSTDIPPELSVWKLMTEVVTEVVTGVTISVWIGKGPAVIMWGDSEKKKTLTHRVFVAVHYCDVVVTVPSNLYWKESPRRSSLLTETDTEWTFPQKEPASLLASERARQHPLFTDVIKSKNCTVVTFHDAWWSRISITVHYDSIRMIINSRRVHV